MPSTSIEVGSNRLFRVKEDSHHQEPVSNFSMEILGSVHVSPDAGGSGLLLKLKRFPDDVEKVVFCPMSEVSSTVKQFMISINQQFPGGTLFLLLSDHEFKKLLMDLSSAMLESSSDTCQKHAVRIVGRNQLGDEDPVWVLSEEIQISSNGSVVVGNDSPFLWLRRIINGSNVLVQESLRCMISTPLDVGESLNNLCLAVRRFMPENFTAAMATISAVVMGANYVNILKMFGCCGVPILTGPPGSCKSEASKCGLAVFGAHESHTCNSQTTPSYLFKTASKTTIPICVDDVNEKAADAWEELFIDAYNGTGRGTRMYGVEAFKTLPIVSANWNVGSDRPRAHTRAIHIAFHRHDDEPGANLLFAGMAHCRVDASKSVGKIIQLSSRFERPETKDHINRDICPIVTRILSQFDAPARFTTTMSIFMYFFLEFSKIAVESIGESVRPLLTEDDCWEFFADNMAPFTSSTVAAHHREPREDTLQVESAKEVIDTFFHLLGEALQSVPTYRALQMVSVDVATACHLRLCIAVRLTEAVPLVNSREDNGEPRIFTNSQLESALRVSGLGKRSKQRFLRCSSRDSVIKSSRKGSGGNTSPYGCFVVKQSAILETTINLLRQVTQPDTVTGLHTHDTDQHTEASTGNEPMIAVQPGLNHQEEQLQAVNHDPEIDNSQDSTGNEFPPITLSTPDSQASGSVPQQE